MSDTTGAIALAIAARATLNGIEKPEHAKNCGNCSHLLKLAGEMTGRGRCHANPPTPFANGVCVRPDVNVRDKGCHLHESGEPETWRKVNPETPGQAAKAKRGK